MINLIKQINIWHLHHLSRQTIPIIDHALWKAILSYIRQNFLNNLKP